MHCVTSLVLCSLLFVFFRCESDPYYEQLLWLFPHCRLWATPRWTPKRVTGCGGDHAAPAHNYGRGATRIVLMGAAPQTTPAHNANSHVM